jgi:hypothetical protein
VDGPETVARSRGDAKGAEAPEQLIAELIEKIGGDEQQFAAREKNLDAKQVELEKREQAPLQKEISFAKTEATFVERTQPHEQ